MSIHYVCTPFSDLGRVLVLNVPPVRDGAGAAPGGGGGGATDAVGGRGAGRAAARRDGGASHAPQPGDGRAASRGMAVLDEPMRPVSQGPETIACRKLTRRFAGHRQKSARFALNDSEQIRSENWGYFD